MKFSNFCLYKTIDEKISILGLTFSAILVLYLLSYFNRFIYVFSGILSFLSFTIWFFIRNKASITFSSYNYKFTNKLLLILFFNLFTLSIVSLYNRPVIYERPLIYFILNSFLVGTLAFEILNFQKKSHYFLIVSQIILLGIYLSWSQLLIYPSLVGIDPWAHQVVVLKIIATQYIPTGSTYSKLPLFHLFIAFTSLIAGFDYKFATMFSVSLSQIICNVLFVFLFARVLYPKNYKVCCLAPLVTIISNHHILMSYWSIPNAFGAIFIFPLLYILVQLKKYSALTSTVLSIFFAVTLILTHTIVSTFMAIVLFVYWISSFIYNVLYLKYDIMDNFNRNNTLSSISMTYCVLFSVMMFGWWTYVSGHITKLSSIINWGFSPEFFVKTPIELVSKGIGSVPFSEQLFDNIGMFLFFSISFIGCLYMISENYGNKLSFTIALVGITPLALGYFSILSNTSILEHRWWYFAQITLSIPIAIALLLISNMLKKNSKTIFLVLFFIIISFFMFMNPNSNVDNHVFSPNSSMAYGLTSSEMQAIKTCSNIWNGKIKTDTFYAGTQRSSRFESFDEEIYHKKNELLLKNHLILIRNNILNKPSMVFQSLINPQLDIINRLDYFYYNNIYTNGAVKGYEY